MQKSVHLRCPVCEGSGSINISEDVILTTGRGILTVNVVEGAVCSHSFVVYLDMNFDIRDYFLADFTVELPKMEALQETRIEQNKDILDMYLIRMNLLPLTLTFIIKACFSKSKLLIIQKDEFIRKHILTFLEYILKDSFDAEISIDSKKNYIKNKKGYKNYIVIEEKEILKDKKKIVDVKNKKLKIERKIVQLFFSEQEDDLSLFFLKNEIKKAYILSNSIVKYLSSAKKEEKLSKVLLIINLEKEYNVKISDFYFDFLMNIAINYFKVKPPQIYGNLLSFL